MSGKLDAWITGNHGLDHPDNAPLESVLCAHCRVSHNPEDITDTLCDDCRKHGKRRCHYCEDIRNLDEMRAWYAPMSGHETETLCEDCAREYCEDCGHACFDGEGYRLYPCFVSLRDRESG